MSTEGAVEQSSPSGDLLAALGRLDSLLAHAVARAEAEHGGDGRLRSPFRGLHVELAEVARLLVREPGTPVLGAPEWLATPPTCLQGLAGEYELEPFDVDVLIVALAPDVDLRYERVYAYLQDDMTLRRATVDLALDLLCADASERLRARRRFAADAPLRRHGLLRLVADPAAPSPPLLAHQLAPDDQLLRELLATGGLDDRLARFCTLSWPRERPDEVPLPTPTRRSLAGLAPHDGPVRLYLHGPAGAGKTRAAAAFAAARGRPLLEADLARAPAPPPLRVLFRDAELAGAVLSIEGIAALDDPRELLAETARAPGDVILRGDSPWPAHHSPGRQRLGIHAVEIGLPDYGQRRALWREAAGDTDGLDALAARFRLSPAQIDDAAAAARAAAAWRVAGSRQKRRAAPTIEDLFAAARARTGHELRDLARKADAPVGWSDIVLPDAALAQLHELCDRVAQREQVLGRWGFGAMLSRGRSVAALFSGPPGTGKTMAAEIIARELGLDLHRIDLSGVVSKWIGETEKNLSRIFDAAERANVVLLFDEAEALFGKRSEVRDSHDRYANVEVAYLLQRLETYDGLAILATNHIDDLDDAFMRRLTAVVRFPFPQAQERLAIWRRAWPAGVPRAPDLDLERLADRIPFTGAEIRNAALAAAFLAAAAGGPVTTAHVEHAVRREYEKLGRTIPDGDS
jgi:winged helix domain-containing protein/ATPase family protein associated with various cellular activities (AAA)